MRELEIDILLIQEWGGWQGEEEEWKRKITGYTNFMSFKKRKEKEKKTPSILAMKRAERKEYFKERTEKRKRGTTILVKNELINLCNVRELEITKDGEIEVIEITIGERKTAIISMHAEPEKDKEKKRNFFKKIKNIVENNIKEGARTLLGGDANSVWEDEDTSNKDKKDLDKSIKEFCKEIGWTDLSLKWSKKNKEEKGEEWTKYTWEGGGKERKIEKRLDGFWGPKIWLEEIRNVVTMEERKIPSDHKIHILDWETQEEIKIEKEEEKEEIKINNKKRAELMNAGEWEEYKKKVKEEIGKSEKLKNQEEKMNKREGLTND